MEKRIHLLERQNITLAKSAHHIGSNEPARPFFSKKQDTTQGGNSMFQSEKSRNKGPSLALT